MRLAAPGAGTTEVTVRLPTTIYRRIAARVPKGRSMSSEIIALLERGLEADRRDQEAAR
jgi:hypothetical protein